MKKRQIISILNDLNIDKDKYIITGETALTIYGIIKECDYISGGYLCINIGLM